MRITKLTILFILILTSCAGTPVREDSGRISIDKFKQELTSVNKRLWGSLSRYKYNNDLSTLIYQQYLKHIDEMQSNQSKHLLETIKTTETHLFKSEKGDFYVCFRSEKLVYVLCDRASTTGVDKTDRDTPLKSENIVLEQLKSEQQAIK